MNKNRSGGLGITDVLQIVFIVLKCLGFIDWSWWVVLIPLWINLGLIIIYRVIWIIHLTNMDYKYRKRK